MTTTNSQKNSNPLREELTEADQATIRELFMRGFGSATIALRTGLKAYMVVRYLKQNNLKRSPHDANEIKRGLYCKTAPTATR